MHACAESSSRINLNQQLVLMLLRNRLPGWLNQDIIHCKWFKILFPVVNPVFVLCFGCLDCTCAQVGKHFQFFQRFIYFFKHARYIGIIVQIKADFRYSFAGRQLREYIDEHPFCLFFRKRNIILDFNTLDSDFIEGTAN